MELSDSSITPTCPDKLNKGNEDLDSLISKPVREKGQKKDVPIQDDAEVNAGRKAKRLQNFMVEHVKLDGIDIKNLNEEEKATLKERLEKECLDISNCYMEVLAVYERWEKYDDIRMASDADLDDLFDENNQKLKSKLKIIAVMLIGGFFAWYFEQTWIWFAFQLITLLPYIKESIQNKEGFDTVLFPSNDSYFGQNYVTFGFKVKGSGRAFEYNKALYPKSLEAYSYFKETQAIIRSLRPAKNAIKDKKEK